MLKHLKITVAVLAAMVMLAAPALVLADSVEAKAQVEDKFLEGTNYFTINNAKPIPAEGPVEVASFFWYGCGNCFKLDAMFPQWAAKLPEDVRFTMLPATFGGTWDIHGKIYLTIQALKLDNKIHNEAFNAVQNQGARLHDRDVLKIFLDSLGVDSAQFFKVMDSPEIDEQAKQIAKMLEEYQVDGVPAIVVGGKYRFDIASAGNPGRYFELGNFLIDKVKAERAATPPTEEKK